MDRKRFFQLMAALALFVLVGIAALYAQTTVTLQNGVYRYSGIPGEGRVVYYAYSRNIIVLVYDANGSIAARATARINGNQVYVSFGDNGNQGFETWTIIDSQTFRDDNYGNTWRWVRNATQIEVNQLR